MTDSTAPTTYTQGQAYPGGGTVNFDAQTGKQLAPGATTTLPPPPAGTVVKAPQGTDTIGAYSSPIITSSASRAALLSSTQLINDKTAAIAGNQQTQTPDPTTGKPAVSTDTQQPTASTQPETVYVDQNFANTHDMSNPAFANYKVGNAPAVNTPATTATDPTGLTSKYESDKANIAAKDDALEKQATDAFQQWKTNDPALNGIIDSLKATFEDSIAQMKETNRQLTARDTATGYKNDGARYAPGINDSAIADTVQKGVARINTLVAQEAQALFAATQAKNDKDLAKVYEYTNQIKQLNNDKAKALMDLHTQLIQDQSEVVKQSADQRANDKALIASNKVLADNAAKAGYADAVDMTPEEKTQYYAAISKQLGLHPDEVAAAFETYGVTASKAEIANNLNIARTQRLTDQTANDTAKLDEKTKNDVARANISQQNANANSSRANTAANKATHGGNTSKTAYLKEASGILESGITTSGSKVGNPRGADGYVDPALYVKLYNKVKNDKTKGATGVAEFFKANPPEKLINPEALKTQELPTEIINRIKSAPVIADRKTQAQADASAKKEKAKIQAALEAANGK